MGEKMESASDYTFAELLVATAAREIKDGDVVFAGVGLPTLGALVAKLTHAPSATVAMESGSIGCLPYRIILGIGDNACIENAVCATSLWRLFSDQQRGFFDVGMVGGAQVDKYGNLNSTAIFGDGDYYHPRVRLPGSGGANDIGSSAKRTIITMPLDKRRFLEKVDYITTPGYLSGGNDRKRAGLPGDGPVAIITSKCIFRFDPIAKEAFLDAIAPGATVEEIKAEVSWDLRVAENVKVMEPPTVEQIRLIRTLDAHGIYTGSGLKGLTFDAYIKLLEDSYEAIHKLFQR